MSAYEKLVERCEKLLWTLDPDEEGSSASMAKIIIAEVLRTLETVTLDMRAAMMENFWTGHDEELEDVTRDWMRVLRASPLAPPK